MVLSPSIEELDPLILATILDIRGKVSKEHAEILVEASGGGVVGWSESCDIPRSLVIRSVLPDPRVPGQSRLAELQPLLLRLMPISESSSETGFCPDCELNFVLLQPAHVPLAEMCQQLDFRPNHAELSHF